jgi:intracellular sulfur oxidation DsrE/DsrF family protein
MAGEHDNARRLFLSWVGAGAIAASATATASAAGAAQAPAGGNRPWQPAHHPQDDWLDQLPGTHRFVIDTTTPAGFENALLYVGNYFTANVSGYGLTDKDLAVVIVARHDSTPFAYTDSMWAKYGPSLALRSGFVDPSKRPPATNLYRQRVDNLITRGVHLAVCQMATRRLATTIADANGGKADDVYAELTANLFGNAHMVPAGIVAVNRAQERGYSFAHAV